MKCQFSCNSSDARDVSLDEQIVSVKDTFQYLISILQSNGEIDEDVNHKIKA
jgi:hypothetical protein